MVEKPKPDLSEYEEESVPFDDVLRTLLKAKPSHGRQSEERPKGRQHLQDAKSKSDTQ